MRAIFYSFNSEDSLTNITVLNEGAKHLQVVRTKVGDDLLVLNGAGAKAYAKVSSMSKREVLLTVSRVEMTTPLHFINLAIANPKKDAFEDIIKMSVELGIVNIFPLKSEYSQYDYLKSERLHRIMENALVQSNNTFLPVIHDQVSLGIFLKGLTSPLFFFNSKVSLTQKVDKSLQVKTLLIGPEGGFSLSEEAMILSHPGVISIHMATPIQRAPTAVASSVGYLLSP